MAMRLFHGRLMWTHEEEASAEFWRKWWMKDDLKLRLEREWASKDFPYARQIVRYLPKPGRILEAGCGSGAVLGPLLRMGYQIEGIEYSRELVNEVNKVAPDLPIRWGDATHIEMEDNSYDGYVSLGVMEHRVEGPELFLKECVRVLKSDGIAFISVPFYDFLWKLRSRWLPVGWPDATTEERFFQWHFTRRELVSLVQEAGLEVVATGSWGVRYGALRSVPLWNWIYHRRGGYRLWKLLSFTETALPWCGWMQWVVARKR